MPQEIITYLILLITFAIVARKIYRSVLAFSQKKGDQDKTGKCASCSADCTLKDLTGNPDCPPNSEETK